jgi:hypothetical protein
MIKSLTSLLLGLLLLPDSGVSGIIPANRLTTWYGNVGVPGGIPSRTQMFVDATKAPYNADNTGKNDASSAINAAIGACPPNQYVYLPAGIYLISGGIVFPAGTVNVTLRGAGNSTVLKNATSSECIHIGGSSNWPIGGQNQVSWTGGLAQGSTVLTVSSAANYQVGQLMWLTQDDDTSLIWAVNGVGTGINGNIKELKRVVAVNGNQITIDTPIIWNQWNPALHPIASNDAPSNPVVGCSLESVQIDGSGNTTATYALFMDECYGCWLLNVYSYLAHSYHMSFYNVARCEFRRVTLWDAQLHAENCGGFYVQLTATSCLWEDNIIYKQYPGIETDASCAGNAFLYNFIDQSYQNIGGPSVQGIGIDSNHAPHGCMNLYEGNYSNCILNDGYWGSGSHFIFFRNRLHGYDETLGAGSNSMCVGLDRWSLYNSVVGNVLGTTGVSNVYDEQTVNYPDTDCIIYRLGYPNLGNGSFTGYRPPLTYAQDAASGTGSNSFQGLDEAVRPTSEYASGGVSTPVQNPPQTPRAGTVRGTSIIEGNYDTISQKMVWNDPTIGAQAIPKSLYYPSKPAYFNSLTWPPFDPANPGDTSKANVPAGGAAIPAGYRFLHNADPPPASTSAPAPPQNLRIVN